MFEPFCVSSHGWQLTAPSRLAADRSRIAAGDRKRTEDAPPESAGRNHPPYGTFSDRISNLMKQGRWRSARKSNRFDIYPARRRDARQSVSRRTYRRAVSGPASLGLRLELFFLQPVSPSTWPHVKMAAYGTGVTNHIRKSTFGAR